MLERLVIYGAGKRGKKLIQILEFCNISITAVIDSDNKKWQEYVGAYQIESPEVLLCITDCVFCITAGNVAVNDEIRASLMQNYGYDQLKEIAYMDLILYAYGTLGLEKFGVNNVIVANKENWSVIFDCEYGLGLGGIEEWTKGICGEFVNKGEMRAFILSNYSNYKVPRLLENNILRVDVNPENAFLPNNIIAIVNIIMNYLPCTLVTSQPNEVLIAGYIIKSHVGSKIQIVSGIRGGSDAIYQNYVQMKKCTDLYVCVSSEISYNMTKRGIEESKVLTMICPVSCPGMLRRGYTYDRREPIRLGYAGRIVVEQKRMDLMLKLLDLLRDQNINFYIEFAGGGTYEAEIRKYIGQNHCKSRIKLVGQLDKEEIADFWLDKDICLNLADYEGRSRSVAEAMANGAIPVVTETSGVHDDICEKVNGYIVPIGDYVEMANCIMELEKNRELLPIMGERAHLEIKSKCSMEEHYQFWINIVENWKRESL